MNDINYNPIGMVYSPFKKPSGTPIQAAAAWGSKGSVEVYPQYSAGLDDLDGFSHIILIYHFHLASSKGLKVKPFLDNKEHGVFATRGPARPNPIGLSVVRLLKIEGNILRVQDIDILNNTPLLDIKPYLPEFDSRKADKIGWLATKVDQMATTVDDGRFA